MVTHNSKSDLPLGERGCQKIIKMSRHHLWIPPMSLPRNGPDDKPTFSYTASQIILYKNSRTDWSLVSKWTELFENLALQSFKIS